MEAQKLQEDELRRTFRQPRLRSMLIVRITLPKRTQSSRSIGLVRFHRSVNLLGHFCIAMNVCQQLLTVPSFVHERVVPPPFLCCSLSCNAPEGVPGTFSHAILFSFLSLLTPCSQWCLKREKCFKRDAVACGLTEKRTASLKENMWTWAQGNDTEGNRLVHEWDSIMNVALEDGWTNEFWGDGQSLEVQDGKTQVKK